MSLHTRRDVSPQPARPKTTFTSLAGKKAAHQPIVALTAYDYPSARIVDEATDQAGHGSAVDLVLVGDSLGMVALGYDSTLPVTLDEMLHHTRAVRRGVQGALLVADMPFGTYEGDEIEALRHAIRFVKEAGAEAVKIEGVRPALASRLVEAEVPVVAHLGLTPQSVHRMGGYRVQARTAEAAESLLRDALAMEAAGCALLVLEGVPREVAARITAALHIPVIGIGAGSDCDGQILVLHDLLHLTFAPAAKFVRRYADVGATMRDAVARYAADVTAGAFPAEAESYHLSAEERNAWMDVESTRGAGKL